MNDVEGDGCLTSIIAIFVFLTFCILPVEMGWANSAWEWVRYSLISQYIFNLIAIILCFLFVIIPTIIFRHIILFRNLYIEFPSIFEIIAGKLNYNRYKKLKRNNTGNGFSAVNRMISEGLEYNELMKFEYFIYCVNIFRGIESLSNDLGLSKRQTALHLLQTGLENIDNPWGESVDINENTSDQWGE